MGYKSVIEYDMVKKLSELKCKQKGIKLKDIYSIEECIIKKTEKELSIKEIEKKQIQKKHVCRTWQKSQSGIHIAQHIIRIASCNLIGRHTYKGVINPIGFFIKFSPVL